MSENFRTTISHEITISHESNSSAAYLTICGLSYRLQLISPSVPLCNTGQEERPSSQNYLSCIYFKINCPAHWYLAELYHNIALPPLKYKQSRGSLGHNKKGDSPKKKSPHSATALAPADQISLSFLSVSRPPTASDPRA